MFFEIQYFLQSGVILNHDFLGYSGQFYPKVGLKAQNLA